MEKFQKKFSSSIPNFNFEDKNSAIFKLSNKNTQKIDEHGTGKNKLVTPLSNSTAKFPTKFMEVYRQSIGGSNNKLNILSKNEEELNNFNTDDSLLVNKNSINIFNRTNTLKDDTIIEGEVEDKN